LRNNSYTMTRFSASGNNAQERPMNSKQVQPARVPARFDEPIAAQRAVIPSAAS
jgi:hypothetical protein